MTHAVIAAAQAKAAGKVVEAELYGRQVYAFLFGEAESHKHGEWKLLKREPGAAYKSCLEF